MKTKTKQAAICLALILITYSITRVTVTTTATKEAIHKPDTLVTDHKADKPPVAESTEKELVKKDQIEAVKNKAVYDWPQVTEFKKRIKSEGIVRFSGLNGRMYSRFNAKIFFNPDGDGEIIFASVAMRHVPFTYEMNRNGEIRLDIIDQSENWPPMLLRRDADSMFLEVFEKLIKSGDKKYPKYNERFLNLFPFRFVKY